MKSILIALMIFLTSCSIAEQGNVKKSITEEHVLFDGSSLDQFDYMKGPWEIQKDGSVKGETSDKMKIKKNTFLITKDHDIADFEANVWYKLTTANNSGVIYRCVQIEDPALFRVKGYQCEGENDLLKGGFMYDEADRAWIASPGEMVIVKSRTDKRIISQVNNHEKLIEKKFVNDKEWNHLRIIARGNHLTHYINGQLSIEVIDEDPTGAKRTGAFALQIHAGKPMTVFFKDVKIQKYTTMFGKAQAWYIDNLDGWQSNNASLKKVSFTSPNERGLKSRKIKEKKFTATEIELKNGSLSRKIPKDGLVRFHLKGKAELMIGGQKLILDQSGNLDGFSHIEALIKDGKVDISVNNKLIKSTDYSSAELKISAESAAVRNVIFIPFK
jgi:hypothetical protein